MRRILGLTWDHPRAYQGLEAATARWAQSHSDLEFVWHRQPLRGFESRSIEGLAQDYDFIVLDHPFMGDAERSGALHDLAHCGGRLGLDLLDTVCVGPQLTLYRTGTSVWAIPLDAAAQVSAFRTDRLRPDEIPRTLEEAFRLGREVGIGLALAPPHALMNFFSLIGILGYPPVDGEMLFADRTMAREALRILQALAKQAGPAALSWNSIDMLDAMARNPDIAYCPLIFLFLPYADRANEGPLGFSDAPDTGDGSIGRSVLGGAGLAVSARCDPTDEILEYLSFLSGLEGQSIVAEHAAHPVLGAVWSEPTLDRRFNGSLSRTRATIENGFVRPRYAGYIGFQERGGELLRDWLAEGGASPDSVLENLSALHETAWNAAQ